MLPAKHGIRRLNQRLEARCFTRNSREMSSGGVDDNLSIGFFTLTCGANTLEVRENSVNDFALEASHGLQLGGAPRFQHIRSSRARMPLDNRSLTITIPLDIQNEARARGGPVLDGRSRELLDRLQC